MTRKLLPLAALLSLSVSSQAFAGPGFAPGPAGLDYYSSQNLLIGATQSLQASASYGQGVTVATIDTGIESSWVGFGGLTIATSSCINAACAPTIINSDDNGHGTFVASEIIGGAQFSNGNGMLGVAPLASLDAIKVLNAQGSGSSTDVANAIRYAADQGAKVLNLSLGPTGTQASQVAFYNSIASAVDYAASRNAVIIFAGGNSGQYFNAGGYIGTSNKATNLFTDAAMKHILFVGSVNSTLQYNSYSNRPGSTGIYTSSGIGYSYQSLWVVADGGGVLNGACVDCIVGAPNVPTANYLALDAGTSMAAPQVAGAAALLAARWPQLIAQGTITTLLRQTATDLGAHGVDQIYGNGIINLTKAFQPVGGLSALTSGGGSVSVTGGSGSVVSGGALGSMAHVSAALSNYTAFDGYQRDFQLNLSGLVASKTSSTPASQSIGAPKVSASTSHFADGSQLAYASFSDEHPMIDHPAQTNDAKGWFVSFSDASGSSMAAGSGFPASASFADALWGGDSQAAGAMATLGVSESLLNLAQGGTFVSFGNQLDKNTRAAFSWSQTQQSDIGSDWSKPDATSFTAGLNTSLTDHWKGGVTFGLLDETSGLLGSTYATNGPVGLGETHASLSMGVSSSYDFGDKRSLLIDAAIVRTGGSNGKGIISGVTPLYASSFGAALVQDDALRSGDHLSLSLRAPLRVFSGSATLAASSVDANGIASVASQRVSLIPTGGEMDFAVGYNAPLSENLSWNATIDARHNADNVSGNNDADILIGTKLRF